MAKVIITKRLEETIYKKFKGFSVNIFELMYTLIDNPKKGKPVGNVSGIVIKELKFESFRFYFICDGYKVKFLEIQELNDILIKFVAMSDKKDQQKVIEEIKRILRTLGSDGFN